MPTIKNELKRIRNNSLLEKTVKIDILYSLKKNMSGIVDSNGFFIKNEDGYFRVDVKKIDGREVSHKFFGGN